MFLGLEIRFGQGAFQPSVPFQIDESALLGDRCFDPSGEVHRRFIRLARHRRQVVDIDDDRPGGHHQNQVLEQLVFGRVPEGIAESVVVLDRHGIDRGFGDLEAALLEHHHRGVVDARAFGKDQNGQIVLHLDMFAHLLRDHVSILRLRALEPDVIGRLRERALDEPEEPALTLSDHREAVVRGKDDHVDRRSVIGDADRRAFRAVLRVMKGDDRREDPRENPMQDDVDVEAVAHLRVANGKVFQEHRRTEHPEDCQGEQTETKGKQETVTSEKAQKPQGGDAQRERAVLLLRAGE